MVTNNTLISICIPTYNGEKYLQEALDSVKEQTYSNIEVIISDDNSKDNTLTICRKFKEDVDFLVTIVNHTPSGIGANWNNCIQNSNGDYIKFLFQDDKLEPNCIELMLKCILKEHLDVVICKRNIISNNIASSELEEWVNKYGDLQKGIGLEFENFYLFRKSDLKRIGSKYELSYNFIGEPVTALFSKFFFEEVGLYSTNLKQLLDLEYYLKILQTKDIGIMSQKLISFRVHSNQASSINSNVDESLYIEDYLLKNFNNYLSKSQKKKIIYKKYPLLEKIVRLKYKYLK